jgi:hypothetical protein
MTCLIDKEWQCHAQPTTSPQSDFNLLFQQSEHLEFTSIR